MKQVKLTVEDRNTQGRSANLRLRKAGDIPAIVYGPSGNRQISINDHQFQGIWKQIAGRNALIEIYFGGEDSKDSMFSIIQDVQRDTMTDKFLHIDFKEIVRGQDMEVDVYIYSKGEPNGVKNQGGVLEQQLKEVGIRCRPRNLPEYIEVDVSALNIAESVHVSDLPQFEGVTYTSDPDLVVFSVSGVSEDKVVAEEGELAEA